MPVHIPRVGQDDGTGGAPAQWEADHARGVRAAAEDVREFHQVAQRQVDAVCGGQQASLVLLVNLIAGLTVVQSVIHQEETLGGHIRELGVAGISDTRAFNRQQFL
ncbi:hypothetical protein MTO96_026471 [Rhipicephalus appendiculatus]